MQHVSATMGLRVRIEAMRCALPEIVSTRYEKTALVDDRVDGMDMSVKQRSTTQNESSEPSGIALETDDCDQKLIHVGQLC